MDNFCTYRVKCRSCGKVREFVFGRNVQYSDFIAFINGHLSLPIKNTCECNESHVSLHDLISYAKEN